MTAAERPTDQSSARHRHTPTSADAIALKGPSALPDPRFNAFRKDLADVQLARQVIASHYAEPLERRIVTETALRIAPDNAAEAIAELPTGSPFEMLEDSMGWAWGYAGDDRRVGYVESGALAR